MLSRALVASGLALTLSTSTLGCKKKEAPAPAAPTAPAAKAPAQPAAATPPPATPPPTAPAPAAKDALTVLSAYEKAVSEGRFDDALAFFTDDAEMFPADRPEAAVRGKAALKAHWVKNRSVVPDVRWKSKRIFDLGDTWIMQYVTVGTHGGPLGNIKATNKPIGFEGVAIAHVAAGLMKKLIVYPNTGALLNQIGVLKDEPYRVPALPSTTELIKGAANPANEATLRKIYELVNTKKLAEADAFAAPDLRVDDHGDGAFDEPWTAYRKALQERAKAFPDMSIEVIRVFSIGDFVITQALTQGTHKGPIGGVKATGKKAKFHFTDVVRFSGGKVQHLATYSDSAVVLAQLGLLPPLGPPPAPAK